MTMRTESGTAPLQRVREAAVSLLDAIDAAIDEQPTVDQQMERIRTALLTDYASEGMRSLSQATTRTPTRSTNGRSSTATSTTPFSCDKCDKSFKNEAGLAIHYGRQHKRRRRTSATASSAKPNVEFTDAGV